MSISTVIPKQLGKLLFFGAVTIATSATTQSMARQSSTGYAAVQSPVKPQQPTPAYRPLPAVKGRNASTRELYAMFFSYVVHVDATADKDSQNGIDSSRFRNHVQLASGLTTAEYAYVLESAKRFDTADKNALRSVSDWKKLVIEQRTDKKRISKALQLSIHRPLNLALTTRRMSLDQEIANLGQSLGQQRSAVLLDYLRAKYVQAGIGDTLAISAFERTRLASQPTGKALDPNTGKPVHGPAAVEMQPTEVVLDSDFSCDEYDFSCADAQISYRGPGGEVDLYANAEIGDGAYDLEDDGDVELEDIYSEGDLTTNGSSPVQYCFAESDSCSGYGPFSVATNYDWDSTAAITYYADCGDGTGDWCEYEQDYTAEVNAYIDTPDINQISPSTLDPKTTGTFVIDGEGLISPFQNSPAVTVSSQGTIFSSLSIQSFDAGSGTITVAYTTANNAPPGVQTLTVNNGFGQGTDTLTISAPPPAISSITVQGAADNNLQAGSTQTVVLTGSNFGTGSPILTVENGNSFVSIVAGTITMTSQTVTFQVSTSLSAPQAPVSFGVQVNSGSSPNTANSPSVAIDPYAAPAPSIYDGLSAANNCQGTPISNTTSGDNTQDVYVGQLVQFTGCIPAFAGPLYVTEVNWTISDPLLLSSKAVGGISVNQTTGSYIPLSSPSCSGVSSCDFSPYLYFVTSGTYQFTFTYTLSNNTSASAVVVYSVTGPVPTGIAQATGQAPATNCSAGQFICTRVLGTESIQTIAFMNGPGPALTYAAPQAHAAILFQVAASDPENSVAINPTSYQWTQLLLGRTSRYLGGGGVTRCPLPPSLDNFYPYPSGAYGDSTGTYAVDSPAISLLAASCNGQIVNNVEVNDSFQASMYLLWDPSLNASGVFTPGCAASTQWASNGTATPVASTCGIGSIPVPLAYVTWGYCGDTISTLGNQSNLASWIIDCNINNPSTPQYFPAQSSTGFPVWTTSTMNH